MGVKLAKNGRLSWGQRGFITLIRGYQTFLSPIMGHGCRFSPTCSHYAIDAIAKYGMFRGGFLAARRLGRCHPWGGPGGIDPVP